MDGTCIEKLVQNAVSSWSCCYIAEFWPDSTLSVYESEPSLGSRPDSQLRAYSTVRLSSARRQLLNYAKMRWLRKFFMHDGMAIKVTSSSSLVRSSCWNYSDYKVGTNGYGGSVRVLSWSRSMGTWTEPNTEHVLAMVSCMSLLRSIYI